jgi:hypothetical protein
MSVCSFSGTNQTEVSLGHESPGIGPVSVVVFAEIAVEIAAEIVVEDAAVAAARTRRGPVVLAEGLGSLA